MDVATPEPRLRAWPAPYVRAVWPYEVVVRPMAEQPYGGRGGSVQDPEGNHWSFGSYRPR